MLTRKRKLESVGSEDEDKSSKRSKVAEGHENDENDDDKDQADDLPESEPLTTEALARLDRMTSPGGRPRNPSVPRPPNDDAGSVSQSGTTKTSERWNTTHDFNMTERGITKPPYRDVGPLPGNLQHWKDVVVRDRESQSPTRSEYDHYLDEDLPEYEDESQLQGDVKQWVRRPGNHPMHITHLNTVWTQPVHPNGTGRETDPPRPKPDYCLGLDAHKLPKKVREHLGPKVMPTQKMALPNYIVELKSTDGGTVQGRNQRRNSGAIAAQGYHAVAEGLVAGPPPDDAHVASIGYNGEHMEAHIHFTAPSTQNDRRSDYHMLRIHDSHPVSGFDEYKKTKKAFKNIRDECQRIREDFVERAEDYRIPPMGPPSVPDSDRSSREQSIGSKRERTASLGVDHGRRESPVLPSPPGSSHPR